MANNLSMIQGLFVDGKSNWSALYHEGYPSYHLEFANQGAEPLKRRSSERPAVRVCCKTSGFSRVTECAR